MKKIKIGLGFLIPLVSLYLGSVYMFSKHMIFFKEYGVVSPFKFQVKIKHPEKDKSYLKIQFNPLFSTAHVIYLTPIEEKININDKESLNIKLSIDKPTTLLSLKFQRSFLFHNFKKPFLDMFLDGDITLHNLKTSNEKQEFNLFIDGSFEKDFKLQDLFPFTLKAEYDIKYMDLSLNEDVLALDSDITGTVSLQAGKMVPRKINSDGKIKVSFGYTSALNFAKFLRTVKTVKNEKEPSPEDFKELLKHAVPFVKTLKLDMDEKRSEKYGANSANIFEGASTLKLDFTRGYLFDIKCLGVLNLKGQSEFLKDVFSESGLDEKIQSHLTQGIDKKFDKVKFDMNLNVDLSNLSVFAESPKGDAKINFGLKLNDLFDVRLTFDGGIKDKPFGDLKVTASKSSHKALVDFVDDVIELTTHQIPSISESLKGIKLLPYEAFFKPEQNVDAFSFKF